MDDRLARFLDSLPDLTVHNQYGPSETHVVSWQDVKPVDGTWPAAPEIGRPLQNVKLVVADRHLRPGPSRNGG